QAEGSACELEGIHVPPHGFEDVLEVARAHRRVVRTTDLGHAAHTRLLLPLVHVQKVEPLVTHVVLSLPRRARRSTTSRLFTPSSRSTASTIARRSDGSARDPASRVNFSVTRSQVIGRVTNPS